MTTLSLLSTAKETKELAMKHSHFRLKVNLSKFFHDARQFCWIFIDGTKIQQIMHIKQHINKLFNIAEPFHLLLNDTEYLPPSEDVRILENNETILVVPGSGINNEDVAETYTCNDFVHNEEMQMANVKTKKEIYNTLDVSNSILNNTQQTSISNITKDITFYSVIEDTERSTMIDDDTEPDTDCKVTDNNLTEDCNGTASVVPAEKRKRVRKRRPKNRTVPTSPSIAKTEDKPKKPKIIDSYIIPSGKHIRFENTENEENNIAKQIVQEASTNASINESYLNEASSPRDLSMLLALGQSSTPITFMSNKKIKNEVKVDTVSSNEANKNSNKSKEDGNMENILCNREAKEEALCFNNLNRNIDKLPIMTRKPQVKDIIAFKTLKIGTDYTPQISNFIITDVIGFCSKTATYTLKILAGRQEVQVPFGKFSLSDDESAGQYDPDTFSLNYAQMKEPRLITLFRISTLPRIDL